MKRISDKQKLPIESLFLHLSPSRDEDQQTASRCVGRKSGQRFADVSASNTVLLRRIALYYLVYCVLLFLLRFSQLVTTVPHVL